MLGPVGITVMLVYLLGYPLLTFFHVSFSSHLDARAARRRVADIACMPRCNASCVVERVLRPYSTTAPALPEVRQILQQLRQCLVPTLYSLSTH